MGMTAISALNFVGDGTIFVMKKAGGMIVPALLGGIGGKFIPGTGVGGPSGFLQGAISGALYAWVLSPLGSYIARNSGEGEGKIHANAQDLLRVMGAIAGVAVPVLITQYCGHAVLSGISSAIPSSIGWIFAPGNEKYSFLAGIFVNIAPPITQYTIEHLREEDPRTKNL
jgi:hypothetical protein